MARESEIIYGIHAVRHALQNRPESILEIWLQDGKNTGHEISQITRLIDQVALNSNYVPRATLDRLTGNAVHQGVAVRCRTGHTEMPTDLNDVLSMTSESPRLLLVLDGVQDPHNLGACLRTANAAGVDAVILPKDRAVAITPVVRKVACGAAETTPVITVTNISRTLRELQQAGIWVVGTDDKAEKNIYDLDLKMSVAIVLGAEGEGMRSNTRNHCDYLVSLPMQGTVESLNVSVAAGICLYEAVRQRKFGGVK